MFKSFLYRALKLNYYRYYSNRNILKLKERGMFQDIFPETALLEITDLLNRNFQCVYAGFDPTADSLHVGNLLVIVNLLHWQRGGHQVLALLGGATAKIGDPSGKTMERDELNSSVIENNLKGIEKDIKKIFENHRKYFWSDKDKLSNLKVLNNEDWYSRISGVDLIGGPGRHLRMGTLLSRTSVQNRLNSPTGMSFTEFSYQLFQAYDWLHLFKNYNCRFQIGGNDQMGNIMSGHEMISKTCKSSVYGLTLPLITSEEGDKFGKSAGNAIWLSSKKTSPFTFYQFWMRLSDVDALKLLKLFTFDTLGALKELLSKHDEKPEQRIVQKYLAEKLTLLVHGDEGLKSAEEATKILYEGNVMALGQMNVNELINLFQGASVAEILAEPGLNILQLSVKAKCFLTENDAARIIAAGGFYINQKRVKNPNEMINPDVHKLPNNVTLLRVGKKNYYIIKWL